ncbi:MAG: A/G-specific adenine glycosylase [Promethearchaeota archaeon]
MISKEMLITDFHKLYRTSGLTSEVIQSFQQIIYSYYKNFKRDFPFREDITPYRVLISEIMLQQTQTKRVSEKFLEFIEQFPDLLTLSKAPLDKVLKVWKGLGYNRRAIALKKIADIIINKYAGKVPDSIEILKSFPQIGHNTASSIVAFAFNKPTFFIETNIRNVYIYFFFHNKTHVKDKEILPIVEKTFDKKNPREWYYALMDYGVMLKKTHPELNRKSAHYRKQIPFKGSNRQLRGKILKVLIKSKTLHTLEFEKKFINFNQTRVKNVLNQLEKEGFIQKEGNKITLVK